MMNDDITREASKHTRHRNNKNDIIENYHTISKKSIQQDICNSPAVVHTLYNALLLSRDVFFLSDKNTKSNWPESKTGIKM